MLEAMDLGCLEGGILMTIHRLSQGGADRVAILLANGLAAAGIPTALVVLRAGGEDEPALLALLDPAVVVSHVGASMGSRHLELLRGLQYLRRQIDRARPAIVLASSSNMGLITGLCANLLRRNRPRFIMKLTNPVIRPRDSGALRSFYRTQLYRFIFGHYDRILILTDAEKSRLANMFPKFVGRFETVANPYVTPTMLAAVRREPPDGRPMILTLARMMPQKRLDRLLSAFAAMIDKSARLTILGDGPERGALREQARQLGIAARVEMPGFVQDVVPWLRKADLFVLSSDYEGLPAAVLEALACNVPVVTTDCFDAARSLLGDVAHCAVVPRNDVMALARALDERCGSRGAPEGLRDIARPYGFGAAIAAHVEIVKFLLMSGTSAAAGVEDTRGDEPRAALL